MKLPFTTPPIICWLGKGYIEEIIVVVVAVVLFSQNRFNKNMIIKYIEEFGL